MAVLFFLFFNRLISLNTFESLKQIFLVWPLVLSLGIISKVCFELSYACYPTPPPQTGCNTRSIFKQSASDLNSDFPFSQTGCLTKAKESNLPNYLPIARKVLFTNPSAQAGYDTRSIFKRSLTGLNSEFSFSQTSCLTKAEEPSPSYYLPIAGGRIRGFIPFPRVFARK